MAIDKIEKKVYKKFQSFNNFSNSNKILAEQILNKIFKTYSLNLNQLKKIYSPNYLEILSNAIEDLKKNKIEHKHQFTLKENSLAEISSFEGVDMLKYLIHRYRYEIFPQKKFIDNYPPLVQIEPSSVCNFRCVFCFETDKTFTNKKNGYMGTMKIDLFKKIIDQIEGNVEFVTLASRGEPLVSKNLIEMLEYTTGKFLNLKINTNASLLTEEKSHAILSSGVKTLVFSADAADEKLYSKLRVNGKLSQVLKNIKMFNQIKQKYYKNSKIITRVSGVKFNQDQKFDDMQNLWGELVDQVAFVNYNPWENNYDKKANTITESCSDLWRRMFVWWDGKVNPCDVDYKSKLLIDNIENSTVSNAWNSENYNKLRLKHENKKRSELTPCKSCVQV